jgi:hypothetical protein
MEKKIGTTRLGNATYHKISRTEDKMERFKVSCNDKKIGISGVVFGQNKEAVGIVLDN